MQKRGALRAVQSHKTPICSVLLGYLSWVGVLGSTTKTVEVPAIKRYVVLPLPYVVGVALAPKLLVS